MAASAPKKCILLLLKSFTFCLEAAIDFNYVPFNDFSELMYSSTRGSIISNHFYLVGWLQTGRNIKLGSRDILLGAVGTPRMSKGFGTA